MLLTALALGIGCADWTGMSGGLQGGDAVTGELYYDQAPLELASRDAVFVGEFFNGEFSSGYLYSGDDSYVYTNNSAYAYDVTFTLANPADMFGLTVAGAPIDEQTEDDGAAEEAASMPPVTNSVTTTVQPGSTVVARLDFAPTGIMPDESGYTQTVESDIFIDAMLAKGQQVPDDYPYEKVYDIAFVQAHLIDYCLTGMASYYAEQCGLIEDTTSGEEAETP